MNKEVEIREVRAAETYSIRHSVLRPNQRIEECEYLGDRNATTFHLGAFKEGRLVSIASFFQESHAELGGVQQYRLRGMATLQDYRGLHLGKHLIEEAERILQARNAVLWWCNARTTASGFYEKIGLEVHGDIFDIEPIGPHKLMVRYL